MTNFKNQLEEIAKQGHLYQAVVEEVLDTYETNEDITMWFNDLLQYGCISGMVGSLIYTLDAHKFYDTYYYEIEELRMELEEEYGASLAPKENDTKTYFAWLSFEETARKIAYELEMEI